MLALFGLLIGNLALGFERAVDHVLARLGIRCALDAKPDHEWGPFSVAGSVSVLTTAVLAKAPCKACQARPAHLTRAGYFQILAKTARFPRFVFSSPLGKLSR